MFQLLISIRHTNKLQNADYGKDTTLQIALLSEFVYYLMETELKGRLNCY